MPDSISAGVRSRSRDGGFTIVELMIVIAIVSVLALVALPVYLDYTVRSKVSEALVFMAEAKTSVSDSYYSNNVMPTSNAEAGMRDPNNYDTYDYIRKLEVGAAGDPGVTEDGTITATLKLPGTTSDNKQLQLVPTLGDGEMGWTCQPHPTNGIKTNRIPGECRN